MTKSLIKLIFNSKSFVLLAGTYNLKTLNGRKSMVPELFFFFYFQTERSFNRKLLDKFLFNVPVKKKKDVSKFISLKPLRKMI